MDVIDVRFSITAYGEISEMCTLLDVVGTSIASAKVAETNGK